MDGNTPPGRQCPLGTCARGDRRTPKFGLRRSCPGWTPITLCWNPGTLRKTGALAITLVSRRVLKHASEYETLGTAHAQNCQHKLAARVGTQTKRIFIFHRHHKKFSSVASQNFPECCEFQKNVVRGLPKSNYLSMMSLEEGSIGVENPIKSRIPTTNLFQSDFLPTMVRSWSMTNLPTI